MFYGSLNILRYRKSLSRNETKQNRPANLREAALDSKAGTDSEFPCALGLQMPPGPITVHTVIQCVPFCMSPSNKDAAQLSPGPEQKVESECF